jgi:hypothetical protein
MGQLYLTNVDFLKNGIPASVMAALVCVTLLSSSSVDRTLIAGTIGGRIAWVCIDETYWVRVALSSLLPPLLSAEEPAHVTFRVD